jgi:penicillin-binding protein 1A
VRTGLDVNLQRQAESAIEETLREYGRQYGARQAATTVMDNDGTVRAIVGGRDYSESQFNRATDAQRQPGSSFKPYVYSVAFMHGLKPSTTIVDGPICIGNWCPHNYSGGYTGSGTLTSMLVRSINTIPVKLSIMVGNGNPRAGRNKIVDLAKKMGIRSPLPDTPSLPIGADEVTVFDHTGATPHFPMAAWR